MTKKYFTQEINKVVTQIRARYRPEKIILYGSAAHGKATSGSDIDLLIIKKTKRRFIDRISDVLLSCDYEVPLEPIVYTPGEIARCLKQGNFFIKDILKNGKVIYG